jgi:hypothetical protein
MLDLDTRHQAQAPWNTKQKTATTKNKCTDRVNFVISREEEGGGGHLKFKTIILLLQFYGRGLSQCASASERPRLLVIVIARRWRS